MQTMKKYAAERKIQPRLSNSGRIPGTTLWVKSDASFISSSSFVTPLPIISYSQQSLLLIKDVNLWLACSPPTPPTPLPAGRRDSHLEQRFKNTALSRRALCTKGDAVHHFSRRAIYSRTWSDVVDKLLHKGMLRWDHRKSDESQMSEAATLAPNRLASRLISFVPLCFVQNVSAKTSWAALECVFVCVRTGRV